MRPSTFGAVAQCVLSSRVEDGEFAFQPDGKSLSSSV